MIRSHSFERWQSNIIWIRPLVSNHFLNMIYILTDIKLLFPVKTCTGWTRILQPLTAINYLIKLLLSFHWHSRNTLYYRLLKFPCQHFCRWDYFPIFYSSASELDPRVLAVFSASHSKGHSTGRSLNNTLRRALQPQPGRYKVSVALLSAFLSIHVVQLIYK